MGISPMGNLGCFRQGKPAATESRYPTLLKVHAGSFHVSIIHQINSDMDCRIFNVRTWFFFCVRVHTGVGHTYSESAQHFWLRKIHKFFCAPDAGGVRTSEPPIFGSQSRCSNNWATPSHCVWWCMGEGDRYLFCSPSLLLASTLVSSLSSFSRLSLSLSDLSLPVPFSVTLPSPSLSSHFLSPFSTLPPPLPFSFSHWSQHSCLNSLFLGQTFCDFLVCFVPIFFFVSFLHFQLSSFHTESRFRNLPMLNKTMPWFVFS